MQEIRHKSYVMIVVLLSLSLSPFFLLIRLLQICLLLSLLRKMWDHLLQQMFMCFRCLVLQLRQIRSSY